LHVWETVTMRTTFWWGDLRERVHLGNLGLDGTIILKWLFKKVWVRLIWRRIGPDNGIV